jgi:hypothetical protein
MNSFGMGTANRARHGKPDGMMKFNMLVCGSMVFVGVVCIAVVDNEATQMSCTGTGSGPTIRLEYDPRNDVSNPVSTMMYFVPLISTTLVDCRPSENNQQVSSILAYRRENEKGQFRVVCEFDHKGTGSYTCVYEPNSMVAFQKSITKPGKPMKNILDYIKLEGDGFGWMEVKGQTIKGEPEVREVRVHFNGRDCKSPITIGLYDIEPRKGVYEYANRSNQMVARVNTLTFRKTPAEEKPAMLVEVASIVSANEKEGFWGNLVGAFANLFIPPVEVDKDGNDAMIQFGYALLKGQPTFTFPRAKNLIPRETDTPPALPLPAQPASGD